ncbi:MAG: hypothetical protein R3C18_18375 [Planctomycetaceae bacterium]
MTLTRISKVLAVFLAVGSIAFVGFAIATTFGEPDKLRVLDDPLFDGYAVSKQVGGTQWEAKRGIDGSSVGTSENVLDVIVKVLGEIDQTNKQQVQFNQQQQAEMQTKIEELVALSAADDAALKAFEDKNREYLATITAEEQKTSSDVIAATAKSQQLELELARRRGDVFRLKQQVEELKTDIFRLQQIETQLENLQQQINGDLQRATDRNEQLKERLGS